MDSCSSTARPCAPLPSSPGSLPSLALSALVVFVASELELLHHHLLPLIVCVLHVLAKVMRLPPPLLHQ